MPILPGAPRTQRAQGNLGPFHIGRYNRGPTPVRPEAEHVNKALASLHDLQRLLKVIKTRRQA